MKKFLCVFCSALLCLSLAGCGGEKEEAPFDPETDAAALLETQGVFTAELEEVDQATACALYGIDESTVTGCKVYMANVGVSLEELAIFTFSSEDAARDGEEILQYRVEDQKEAAAGYAEFLKDEAVKLEGAQVERRGNSVRLVIAADYGAVK